MQRHIAAACVVAFAFAAGAVAPKSFAEGDAPSETPPTTVDPSSTAAAAPPEPPEDRPIGRYLLARIDQAQREVWRWERLMRIRRTKPTRAAAKTNDAAHRRAILASLRRKAAVRKRQAYRLPRLRSWVCIYRHERHDSQGWATNTGNGYYGGLQMDLSFQRRYGFDMLRRKGTADRWLPIEQIWVAERAYRSGRGFSPWPRTARFCGLI